mgnify:CR=1 FL=1
MARKKKTEVLEVVPEVIEEEVVETNEEINEATITHEPPKTVAEMFDWKPD